MHIWWKISAKLAKKTVRYAPTFSDPLTCFSLIRKGGYRVGIISNLFCGEIKDPMETKGLDGQWLDGFDEPVTCPSLSEEHLWLPDISLKLGTEAIDVLLDIAAIIIGVFRAPHLS